MAKFKNKIPCRGSKNLELLMRDTMEGLSDSASYMAYQYSMEDLEILSIEPPKVVNFEKKTATVTKVHPTPDISEYLIQRELHFERLASGQ